MPRPLTRSAIERLGRELIASQKPAAAQVEDLHVLLQAYRPVLAGVVEVVSRETGEIPASRIKNTGTILEKLRRNGGHTLSSIQDLAGARIVMEGGRAEQDIVVGRIVAALESHDRPSKIVDRRAEPVQGYRAVHVIAYPDGFPIEIQVRTRWQHQWAELFERLADHYGRGIRYGGPPPTEAAAQVVQWMLQLADQIASSEESSELAQPPLEILEGFGTVLAHLRNPPS